MQTILNKSSISHFESWDHKVLKYDLENSAFLKNSVLEKCVSAQMKNQPLKLLLILSI
jgi:hypothetical protein